MQDNSNINSNQNFDPNINTARINIANDNDQSLFAANDLSRKTADNLSTAESQTNEKPLRTDITDELEALEDEDNEFSDDETDDETDIEIDEDETDVDVDEDETV